MILDAALSFEPVTGTAITTSQNSTNVLDLGANRDIGGSGPEGPKLLVRILAAFSSATASATLVVAVQGAPDNGAGAPGGYQVIQQTPATPLGQLAAGTNLCSFDLDSITSGCQPINSNLTTAAGSSAATVSSAAGLLPGMPISGNANVVPGTTIAAVSGTAVTLSANAAASATLAATVFGIRMRPRFLACYYTVSSTMTAGSIYAGIVLDVDQPALYGAGYSWPITSGA